MRFFLIDDHEIARGKFDFSIHTRGAAFTFAALVYTVANLASPLTARVTLFGQDMTTLAMRLVTVRDVHGAVITQSPHEVKHANDHAVSHRAISVDTKPCESLNT